jgi:hypothetical protein
VRARGAGARAMTFHIHEGTFDSVFENITVTSPAGNNDNEVLSIRGRAYGLTIRDSIFNYASTSLHAGVVSSAVFGDVLLDNVRCQSADAAKGITLQTSTARVVNIPPGQIISGPIARQDDGTVLLPPPTNSAAVDTANINSAITTVTTLGGTVVAGVGIYLLNAMISWPDDVQIWGSGKPGSDNTGGTVFKCTTSGSGFRFGNPNYTTNTGLTRHGKVGNFGIDADAIATAPLQIACVEARFDAIVVRDSAGIGCNVMGAQNNHIDVEVTDSVLSCLVLDGGCGQNRFVANATRSSRYIVEIRQSVTSNTWLYGQPQNNYFVGGVYERPGTTIGGGSSGVGLGIVAQSAGVHNVFDACTISSNGTTGAIPNVLASLDTTGWASAASQQLVFNNCVLDGNISFSTGIKQTGSTRVAMSGVTEFRALLVGHEATNTDVFDDHTIQNPYNNVTTKFVSGGGGSTYNSTIRRRMYSTMISERSASDPVLYTFVTGASGWGPSIRTDRILVGHGATFTEGSIPAIISCTGTPEGAVTAPVGSLALRDDGGASTTLYVKQSGTGNTGWVAK